MPCRQRGALQMLWRGCGRSGVQVGTWPRPRADGADANMTRGFERGAGSMLDSDQDRECDLELSKRIWQVAAPEAHGQASCWVGDTSDKVIGIPAGSSARSFAGVLSHTNPRRSLTCPEYQPGRAIGAECPPAVHLTGYGLIRWPSCLQNKVARHRT